MPTSTRRPLGPLIVLAGTLLVLAVVGLRYVSDVGRRSGWWGPGETTPGASASDRGAFQPFSGLENGVASLLAHYLVEPARPGEALSPHIRYEQAWPQWAFLLVFGGSLALIIWLYRREGGAPGWYRGVLAALRFALVLLAMFCLSEAVLSVERTGLPTFIIMLDDSASGQVVDPYDDPELSKKAAALASLTGRADTPNRLSVGLGWLLQDDSNLLKELSKQQKLKIYRVSEAAVEVAEIDKPEEIPQALKLLKKLEPTGAQTRLGASVREVLSAQRGTAPTAILLVSDGRSTDGPRLAEAAETARKEGVPLYTIGLGDTRPARDLEMSDLQVDEVVFVNDIVRFEARLLARGYVEPPAEGAGPWKPSADGPRVNVHLKRRHKNSNDPNDLETLETIQVPIPPDGVPQEIEVSHKPTEVGPITYVIEVEPQSRELQTDNNRITRTVDVRDEKLKVLLVEGQPRWEFRYLKTYLERDNTINLSYLLQSSDENAASQDRDAIAMFPPGKEGEGGLFSYDVVILGDVDPAYLNAQQMNDLVEFVTVKGGGMMMIAGELFNPLAFKGKPLEPLLPILLTDAKNPSATGAAVDSFHPALTPEGRNHPIFRLGDDEATSLQIWENLPMSDWYFEAPRRQPTAVVLAEHPQKIGPEGRLPILLYHFAGSGKVLFSAIDDTWRWRLRTGDLYFGRYWVQTIRFLARSKLVGGRQAEIATTRKRYRRGQPVDVQVRFPNPALAQDLRSLTVQYQRPGQGPRKASLRPVPGAREKNLFEGTLPLLAEGTYEVQLLPPPVLSGSLPSTQFTIDPPAGEFVRVEMDRDELAAAAKVSDGLFFRWDETPRRSESSRESPASGNQAAADFVKKGSGPPSTSPGEGAEAALLELLPTPQKVPLDTDPPIALWNTWPVFVLFLLLIGAEWVLRKRKQMV